MPKLRSRCVKGPGVWCPPAAPSTPSRYARGKLRWIAALIASLRMGEGEARGRGEWGRERPGGGVCVGERKCVCVGGGREAREGLRKRRSNG